MQEPLDRIEIFLIAGRADHHRLAFASGTSGAANAVHVILRVARYIEIEHMADRRHIKPARGHVGGDQKAQLAISKGVQGAGALRLIKIAVDRGGVIAVFIQRLGNNIDIGFAVAENDGVGAFFALIINHCAQKFAFFLGFTFATRAFEHDHALGDGLGCAGLTGDFDAHRIRQERIGDAFDLRGHRGREKQGLTGEGDHPEDALDIGDKAHVEHPVGLVHHHDLDV